MKQRVGENVTQGETGERGEHAKHERLEAEDHDDLLGVEPLRVYLSEEPPALRDREQHRVERQQQPHHHTDRGEQSRGLAQRLRGLFKDAQFVIRRLDIHSRSREALQLAGDLAFTAGEWLDQDLCDTPRLLGEALRDRQQRDRHRAFGDRADRTGVQHRSHRLGVSVAFGEQRHLFSLLHADRFSDPGREADPTREQQGTLPEIPRRQPPEGDDAPGHANELDRAATPRPDDHGRLAQQVGRILHAGQRSRFAGEPFAEAFLRARLQLQPGSPVDRANQAGRGAGEAHVGDQHPEDERDTDRDTRAGQQLGHHLPAQTRPVKIPQHTHPHTHNPRVQQMTRRLTRANFAHTPTTASNSTSNPSLSRPSRRVCTRSTNAVACGSCVTSNAGS